MHLKEMMLYSLMVGLLYSTQAKRNGQYAIESVIKAPAASPLSPITSYILYSITEVGGYMGETPSRRRQCTVLCV